jgi:hypothetical protein
MRLFLQLGLCFYKIVLKTPRIPLGNPYSWATVSNSILYENEFQNPQIFQQTISLFPKQSTLGQEHLYAV